MAGTRPLIFVGLGGTGGKAIQVVARELMSWVDSHKWKADAPRIERLPQAWQFVNFDVPINPSLMGKEIPVELESRIKYVGLASADFSSYEDYLGQLKTRRDAGVMAGLAGWVPESPPHIENPIWGANQYRAVGRLVGAYQMQTRVAPALDRALEAARSNHAQREFNEFHLHMFKEPPLATEVGRPMIFVINSMGGGAGSGLAADITEILLDWLKANNLNYMNDLYSVMVTPDIYSGLPKGTQEGAYPNALGAITELVAAACQEPDVMTPSPEREFASSLLKVQTSGPRTSSRALFVGNGNDDFSFDSHSAAIRSIGKMLATMVSDRKIVEKMDTLWWTNSQGSLIDEDFVGLLSRSSVDASLAQSTGYSSVTLGNSLFEQYATELIAADAVAALRGLRNQSRVAGVSAEPGEGTAQVVSEEERIKAIAEKIAARGEFFHACGLNEKGRDINDVSDRLWDEEAFNEIRRDLYGSAVGNSGKTFKDQLEDFSRSESSNVLEAFDGVLKGMRDRLKPLWRDWLSSKSIELSREIEDKLLTATSELAADEGLVVTKEVLGLLRQQVRDAQVEMHDEAKEAGDNARKVAGALSKVLKKRRVELGDRMKFEAQGAALKEAADLLDSAANSLIPALEAQLDRMAAELERSCRDEGKDLIASWPRIGGDIPKHLLPAANEHLLIEVSEYPTIFSDALRGTFSGRDGEAFDAAMGAAIREVVKGGWEGEDTQDETTDGQTLFKVGAQWDAETDAAPRYQLNTKQQDSLSTSLSPNLVRGWASRWVTSRRNSRVADQLNLSLREWLDPNGADCGDRCASFLSKLSMAFRYASPLVKINSNGLSRVHGRQQLDPIFDISGTIPLESAHPAQAVEKAKQILVENISGIEDVDSLIDPNAAGHHINIIGRLPQSVVPFVIESLSDPIAKGWQDAASDQARRGKYWKHRRSRALEAFLPIPSESQVRLVKGYIVAFLMNQFRGQNDWVHDGLEVWSPRGWMSFPRYPLAETVQGSKGLLPVVLESLPLAMIEIGTKPAGSDPNATAEGLLAYKRLLDLGSSPNGNGSALSPAISEWLRNGELEKPIDGVEAAPTPVSSAAGPGGPNAGDERVAAVRSVLQQWAGVFEEAAANLSGIKTNTWSLFTPDWEVGALGKQAVNELLLALSSTALQADSSLPWEQPTTAAAEPLGPAGAE